MINPSHSPIWNAPPALWPKAAGLLRASGWVKRTLTSAQFNGYDRPIGVIRRTIRYKGVAHWEDPQRYALQNMKKVLILSAVGEATMGLALLVVPSFVGRLLFDEELTGTGILVGRITGIALIGLGVACWPGPPVAGVLMYSAVVALYLAYVGFAGGLTGILLWPAVVLHLVLTVLLAWAVAKDSVAR